MNRHSGRDICVLIISSKEYMLSLSNIKKCSCNTSLTDFLVQEPVIGLIKWLRPKGLKVCSYIEKRAEFKNQTLKNISWYTKVLCATEYPRGKQYLKIALKWGYPCNLII